MSESVIRRARGEAAARPLDGPEGALIAWLLGLPDGVDAASAARSVLAALPAPQGESAGASRLRALLTQVGDCPAEALPAPARRRRATLQG